MFQKRPLSWYDRREVSERGLYPEMRGAQDIKRRVIFELGAIVLLVVLLIVAFIWRGQQSAKREAEAAITPAPPTAVPTPTAIPADMFEWREGEYVHVDYGTGHSTSLDTSAFTDPYTKNSHDLVEWAKMAWENQWGYVWGTFGDILTEDLLTFKLEQYSEGVGEYEQIIREKWMGRRVADCAGLIKGYGWYDPDRHEISYRSGEMPDCGTEEFYENATVKGDIDTLPETPGLLLHGKGHVGVYIGDGYAIEAIATAGGVVKTKVADRPWLHWMECPYISYD